jgi:catechol 2,3-dioxygenase-like lactoylglutathione lyase family enzyme
MGEESMTPVAALDRLFEAHLIVASLEASIALYRDRLGLELAHVVPVRQAAFFWIGSRETEPSGHSQAVGATLREQQQSEHGLG